MTLVIVGPVGGESLLVYRGLKISLTGIKNALPSTTKFIVGCKSVGSTVKKLRPWSSNMAMENGAGWWFGTMDFFFHHKKGMSSFPLTNSIIFQRGRAKNHQAVEVFVGKPWENPSIPWRFSIVVFDDTGTVAIIHCMYT